VLNIFIRASGGLLNNQKQRIFSWNTPLHPLEKLSQILEIPFQEKWSHFHYLGLPISKKNLKIEIWNKCIEKMEKAAELGNERTQHGRKGGLNQGITDICSNILAFSNTSSVKHL